MTEEKQQLNVGNAVSFNTLETVNKIESWSKEGLNKSFQDLISNILNQQEIIGGFGTEFCLKGLLKEYKTRFDTLVTEEKEIIKSRGSFAIYKDKEGKSFFYGTYSNSFWDRDGEVITGEAHKEYLQYLDENKDQAPELWTFHVKGTARKNRAVWWDYSDNLVKMIWPLEDSEVGPIEKFLEKYDPGLSHGFNRLKSKSDKIQKYRTFEVSILPIEYAANPHTDFIVGTKEKGDNKMNDKALEVLKNMYSEEELQAILERNAKMVEQTAEIEAVQKELLDSENDHGGGGYKEDALVEAVKPLYDLIENLTKQVTALQDAQLKSLEREKVRQTPYQLFEGMKNASQSAIGSSANQVTSKDNLNGPTEAENSSSDDSILNYFPS